MDQTQAFAQGIINNDHLYRVKQIVAGRDNPNPIIPVSKATWWRGIQKGIYPPGIKLGNGVTAWRGSDLREIIERDAA